MSRFPTHGQSGGGGVRRSGPGGPSSRPTPDRGRPGGPREQVDRTVAQVWPQYLEGGYFDEDDHLKVEYVSRCLPGDELLPEVNQHGVEPLIRAMAQDRGTPLTTGQLRRFFGHCRTLETRLKSGAASWAQVRPQFQFLDAAAADAYGKSPRKIPGLFHDFIRRNVAAVRSERDFLQGFLPHFEALVGFGSLHVQRDRN